MSIGIDPTVDFAFKKLLGSPEFPQVTVHFLNSVLGESANVTGVTILNPIRWRSGPGSFDLLNCTRPNRYCTVWVTKSFMSPQGFFK